MMPQHEIQRRSRRSLAALFALMLGIGLFGCSPKAIDTAVDAQGNPTIVSGALADATTFSAYSTDVSAAGGAGLYSWFVTSGVLPPGLALVQGTPTAGIAGTPTIAGVYDFTVMVQDLLGRTDTQDLSITVNSVEASVNSPSIAEGDSGFRTLKATVTLNAAVIQEASVDYATQDDSAVSGVDYVGVSGTLVFAPGETSATFDVGVIGNTSVEADKSFSLVLSNPVNAALASVSSGTATILNDDLPSISIGDATIAEGNSGTTTFDFTVSTSEALPGGDIDFTYAVVAGGTADSTDLNTSATGTATILAGQNSTLVQIDVSGDTTTEVDETFLVRISAPTNATIGTSTGTGTITNDDLPMLTISDESETEGTDLDFTVTLSAWAGKTVTVEYTTTTNGSATQGADFVPDNGTLTFTGPADLTKTVSITTIQDGDVEFDETVEVSISNPSNASVLDDIGVGTIENDDLPTLSVGDATAVENVASGVITFRVSLDAAVSQDVTFDYETVNGTGGQGAVAAGDFDIIVPTQGTISAGGTFVDIDVTLVDDATPEFEETFTLDISSPSANAAIADASGDGTITNDDPPDISIADVTDDESAGTFVFNVSVSPWVGEDITVDYLVSDDTAIESGADDDYDFPGGSATGSVTFTSAADVTITVPIVADVNDEYDETFFVDLTGVSAGLANIADAQAIGTIETDDLAIISVTDVSADEESGPLTFTVEISHYPGTDVTVKYKTLLDGTASAGDFTAIPESTLTFTTAAALTVDVALTGDASMEADETFSLALYDNSPLNSVLLTTTPQAVMEAGVVNVDSGGTTVVLTNTYANPPVVVCMPVYDGGAALETNFSARVSNVTTTQFDVAVEHYNDVAIGAKDVRWFVMEEGAYKLPDGTLIEAGTVGPTTLVGHNRDNLGAVYSMAETVTFTNTYATPPVVLHQVMSENDAGWIASWVGDPTPDESMPPTTTSAAIGLLGAQHADTHPAAETIGWIAIQDGIESTYDDNGGVSIAYKTLVSGATIQGQGDNAAGFPVTWTTAFGGVPVVAIFSQQTQDSTNDQNGSWTLGISTTAAAENIVAEESGDSGGGNETPTHPTAETVAGIAFETAFVGPADTGTTIATGTILDND